MNDVTIPQMGPMWWMWGVMMGWVVLLLLVVWVVWESRLCCETRMRGKVLVMW